MASNFVAVDTQGLEALAAMLKRLPPAVRDDVVDGVSDYLINVYRQYVPYKYVSRKAAYGQTFQSAKQRRWFFAALARGEIEIPYRRTQALRNAWHQVGRGVNSLIANESKHAAWMMGPGEQSRHAIAEGWKDVEAIAKERETQIYRRGEAEAQKAIKRTGL